MTLTSTPRQRRCACCEVAHDVSAGVECSGRFQCGGCLAERVAAVTKRLADDDHRSSQGAVRDKSVCHFRKTATEYDRKPGINWLSCAAK
jgi:hypothetical protein